MDASIPQRSHGPIRFGVRALLATITGLAALFAAFAWFDREFGAPRRHADAVEQLIASLVDRRPPDMTRGQWGSAVAWTMNSHGNSLLMFEADSPTIKDFKYRLTAELAGDVDMRTIHWIWDEYAELCAGGARYQRFRAQMLDEIGSVAPDADLWNINVP